MRATTFALALLALLAVPEAAQACSVCSAGGEDNRAAFIWTTVALSVLPLAMIGGLVLWLVRQARRAERQRSSSSPASEARAPQRSVAV